MVLAPYVEAESILLSGADWTLEEADVTGAKRIPARVPGNIQADLEAAHELAPLWRGAGDPRLAEVAKKDWWYRKSFVLPPTLRNKRLELVFDGVDYEYEVWLNGVQLGKGAGQFRRAKFDISQQTRPGEQNELAVRIKRMPVQLEHCFAASDMAMSGKGTPDFFVDCYAYMLKVLNDLKSTTNLSYDWGVNIYTLGIWRDVRIEASGPVAIESVQVKTSSSGNTNALVDARLELDSLIRTNIKAFVRVEGHGVDQSVSLQARVKPGVNTIDLQINVKNPALWWPRGHGAQSLYHLYADIQDTASGEVLHRKTVRFGVRDIQWRQVEGAPADFPNPYRLMVNGRAVRMMGSSLIPPDLLFGRNNERAPHLLRLAAAAGMNTLRLWGGGVPLPPSFYEMADEQGIMLSQEFPLANTVPEANPVFLANLRATITDMVRELRNHPSIVEWVGGNEVPWPAGPDHPTLQMLKAVAEKEDNRIFRATDPIEGSKHSPWSFTPHTHYDYYNNIEVMRYGEFGTQTPANLEVLRREIPSSSLWPLNNTRDPVLVRKNVLQAAFSPLDWLHKPIIDAYFGPMEKLDDIVRAGQFIGAEGLRYAVDELRRKSARIGGIITWVFNESWPNGAGTFLIDYDGRTLMNYDFLRQALEPVTLSLRYSSNLYDPRAGVEAGLWLVSDLPAASGALQWSWLARDGRGRVLARDAGSTSIAPQEARELGKVSVSPLKEQQVEPIIIELRLTDSRQKILAERVHVFGADQPFHWPLDDFLQGSTTPGYAKSTSNHSPVRVLVVADCNDARYDDMAWYLKRFGIQLDVVRATSEAFTKIAPSAEEILQKYDVVWLSPGDDLRYATLGDRLGEASLATISAATKRGVGLLVEGGWMGYEEAGFSGTALEEVLPVTLLGPDTGKRGASGAVKIAKAGSPLLTGLFETSFPDIEGHNRVLPRKGAHVILKTADGDDLLLTHDTGTGRVLGYASSLVTTTWSSGTAADWGWGLRASTEYPFFIARLLTWVSGASDAAVSRISPTTLKRRSQGIQQTQLRVSAMPKKTNTDSDILELTVENRGDMTALFCSTHPVLEYRTDIIVTNNNVSVPPRESRVISIEQGQRGTSSRTLAEAGWSISCWNTEDKTVPAEARAAPSRSG